MRNLEAKAYDTAGVGNVLLMGHVRLVKSFRLALPRQLWEGLEILQIYTGLTQVDNFVWPASDVVNTQKALGRQEVRQP